MDLVEQLAYIYITIGYSYEEAFEMAEERIGEALFEDEEYLDEDLY